MTYTGRRTVQLVETGKTKKKTAEAIEHQPIFSRTFRFIRHPTYLARELLLAYSGDECLCGGPQSGAGRAGPSNTSQKGLGYRQGGDVGGSIC